MVVAYCAKMYSTVANNYVRQEQVCSGAKHETSLHASSKQRVNLNLFYFLTLLRYSTSPLTTAIISLLNYHHGGQRSLSGQPRLSCVSDIIAFLDVLSTMLTLLFSAIFNSSEDPNTTVSQPVLQCVQVKPLIGQQGAPERFRVVFSDINNFVQSMLATRKHPRLYCLGSRQDRAY